MQTDLDLYRREVRVAIRPEIRLSVVDIAPEYYQRTLFFIHGFGGNLNQWEYQLDYFSSTHRVIAPDLRGHGLSDKPHSQYSLEEILADLEAVLDALGVADRVMLLGHSFGGAIASEFAITRPRRVERLALIASSTQFRINPLYRFLLKLPERVLNAIEPFVRKQLWAPPFVLKAMHTHSIAGWSGPDRYPRISVPTLVIRGHMDRVFEKPQYEGVPRLIPQAEDIDVGASGHMVMLERSQATNRALARFLDGEERSGWGNDAAAIGAAKASWLNERPWLPYYDEGVPTTIGAPRAPLHNLLNSAARRFPNRPAVIFAGQQFSYRKIVQQANAFAAALHSSGVGKGERVMLALPNLPQTVIAFYGALKAGVVVALALPKTSSTELAQILRDCAPRLIVVEGSRLPDMLDAIEQARASYANRLPIVVYTLEDEYLSPLRRMTSPSQSSGVEQPESRSGIAIYPYHSWLGQHKEAIEVEVSPKDLAVIQYTGRSGTRVQGVMLTHRNLLANVLQVRHWMPEAIEGRERFLCVAPVIHSYGMTVGMNLPVALGATMILLPGSDIRDIMGAVQRYRPSIFPGLPQQYLAINNFPEARKHWGDSVKLCISGTDTLPVEVLETFEKLTRSHLVEGYGLTEASPATHINPLNGLRKAGSIGVPLPSTEARLLDLRSGRRQVPAGQIGELAVRGPQVMTGYWNDPAATARVLSPDGWLLTGDVGQVDSQGYFRIIARKADMWYPSRPDQPAFPRDVEEVLYEVPQVKEAAVVIVAGRPIAFVISKKERPTAESLISYCKRRLPPELTPRLIIFVDEFPRSLLGRVLRRELIEQAQVGENK